MNKPQLQTETHTYYDYHEVRDYLKEKYPDFNDRKVWLHIADDGSIYNGSYFTLSVYKSEIEDWKNDRLGRYDDYAYFLELLIEEFGEKEHQFYVCW